jgi:nucleoside 2-deoxyribosyltransferase
MKAYIAIKYHADNRNRECIEAIAAALEERDYQTVCIVRDVEDWGRAQLSPEALMVRSFEEIDSSDLVVVDLTEKGVGLGIEAGYAHARGIPVVTIARRGADISQTLQGISHQVLWYEGWDDLKRVVSEIGNRGMGDEGSGNRGRAEVPDS